MSSGSRVAIYIGLMFFAAIGVVLQSAAQASSSDKSWTTSSQPSDPGGNTNPTRTRTTHSEVNGRIVDKTIVEAIGPDGRYVPYSETERESVRVNDTTVRSVERSYGRNPDGQRVLTQEIQEESRSFSDGGKKVTRTTSNPDGDGRLQVVQRAVADSKQVSPGIRETKTTLSSADGNGTLSPTMQIEERERQVDSSAVESKRSTSLSDGTGHWTLSEIREGITKGDTKEERVLRPNADGKMAVVERTVTTQSKDATGEQRETEETYSTDVPGQAGDEGLQLVKRESTVQRTSSDGERRTTRQMEQPNPGDPGAGLRVTQEAIDIVRPGTNGTATQTSTVRTSDSNGQLNMVWVDMGKTDNPAVVNVGSDTSKQTNTEPKAAPH